MTRENGPPARRYRTIVADPPWHYRERAHVQTRRCVDRPDRGVGASATDVYASMTHEQIAALPVYELAADDAHLYLWVTNTLLFEERGGLTPAKIAETWGFTYKTLLTWDKTGPLGMGRYFRARTEHVLFCTRGRASIEGSRREQNIIHAPNGAHSAKPDAFYDMVQRVSPGPYVELFARRARFGWDYWGDESLGTAVMPMPHNEPSVALSAQDVVNPDDLRFDYKPFAEPLQVQIINSAGQDMGWVHRGRMRAVWESPNRPFYLAWAVEEDMTEIYESEPELRRRVAERLAEAYSSARDQEAP